VCTGPVGEGNDIATSASSLPGTQAKVYKASLCSVDVIFAEDFGGSLLFIKPFT
jgi:hypothetical protein